MFRLTPAVRILLLINIAMYLATMALLSTGLDLNRELGLYSFISERFKPYQFLTYMFLHSTNSFLHIFGNMFGLVVFGNLLEQVLGTNRFFMLYFVCGLGAGILNSGVNYWEQNKMSDVGEAYLVAPTPERFMKFINEEAPGVKLRNPQLVNFMEAYSDDPNNAEYQEVGRGYVTEIIQRKIDIPMVGASGAVFGIILAFALIFPNLQMMLLFPPIPIKAKYLALFYTGFELYALAQNRPDDNIAHFAHIGGMIFAFLLIKYYWRIPRHY
ncbi:MAG: rhomboid family intramembrane serine protease [Thermonemataceae bacterium]